MCPEETVRPPRVTVYGQTGTYSHAAACRLAPDGHYQFIDDFEEALRSLGPDRADLAVLPLENSSAGSVLPVLDNLIKYRQLQIVAELTLPIHHVLAAKPGTRLEDITTVYSHDQALRQTRSFWRAKGWQRSPARSTAGAASQIAQDRLPGYAAICSAFAADLNGLTILARDIQDVAENSTRFVLVAAPPFSYRPQTPAGKGAYTFTVNHESGALLAVLQAFANAGLNLVKLESRPVPQHPFKYRFFVDIDLQAGDLDRALTACQPLCRDFHCLGRYPVFTP
ncbi:prephenate dehydratase [Peptococcus simiae]|uniref:Prephenate dehydratase n=1 Tax=Peptococcus simiae TaxID=1643805 RepID=A0ABW9GZR3_9FIRM